ncbi:MAG TPA: LysM peptidoglycan-binding domain-containing protein [Calditerricola sp.]
MKLHIASGGETLTKIARLYRVDLPALCRANPQIGPAEALPPGTKVRVPVPRVAPVRRRVIRAAEPASAPAERPASDENRVGDETSEPALADGSFSSPPRNDGEASTSSAEPPTAHAEPSSSMPAGFHAYPSPYGYGKGSAALVPPTSPLPAYPLPMVDPYGWYGWPWSPVTGWGGVYGSVSPSVPFPLPPQPLLHSLPSTLYHSPTLWEAYAEDSEDS